MVRKNIRKKIALSVVALMAIMSMVSCGGDSSSSSDEVATDTISLQKGKSIFNSSCKGCHGEDGQTSAFGLSDKIAGQEKEGTVVQLKGYKDGTLDSYGAGDTMSQIIENFSDNELESVALYIESLVQ